MRKLYFSELLACYDLEKKRFAALTSSNKSEVPPENSEDSSED
jgi:hypothetical protein